MDHLHIISQLINHNITNPCLTIVHYEEAFDSVGQDEVLSSIHKQGINMNIKRLLHDFYTKGTTLIRSHTKLTSKREYNTMVKYH